MSRTRQTYHFTPPIGWTNDPNGLICIAGTYHLFYQHYPDDTHWGPMHWGHAVSKDLLHWEHLPIAILPTETEYIFSGSTILDAENVSELGEDGKPVLLAFYTAHNPVTGEQKQCLAYSTDYVNFTKYAGNPLIDNDCTKPGFKRDFRDPKVFHNAATGGYGMVLAVNDAIEFYGSEDLLHWQKTGAFYPGRYGLAGLCECPDFFSMEGENETKYVLTMSMIFKPEGAAEEAHIMQYFVGDFDGKCFVNPQAFKENHLIDFGPDNYAQVTFAGIGSPLALGWGEDWNAANRNTEVGYFGKMTLTKKLALQKIDGSYYLTQNPIAWSDGECNDDLWQTTATLNEGECFEAAGLQVTNLGSSDGKGSLKIGDTEIARAAAGSVTIEAFYDHGYLELFADEGRIAYSKNIK